MSKKYKCDRRVPGHKYRHVVKIKDKDIFINVDSSGTKLSEVTKLVKARMYRTDGPAIRLAKKYKKQNPDCPPLEIRRVTVDLVPLKTIGELI